MIHKLGYDPENVQDPRLPEWLEGAKVYRSQADLDRFTREVPKAGDTIRFLIVIGPKKRTARERFNVFVPAHVTVEVSFFNTTDEDIEIGDTRLDRIVGN